MCTSGVAHPDTSLTAKTQRRSSLYIARNSLEWLEARDAALESGVHEPVTVFTPGVALSMTFTWIDSEKERCLSADDFLNNGFFDHVIFLVNLLEHANKICEAPGDKLGSSTSRLTFASTDVALPPGPYYLNDRTLHRVSRLYSDPLGAFMYGTLSHDEAQDVSEELAPYQIPVPSRLYFDPSSVERPLSGKRVAVKDVYRLTGTKTSASCRDYRDFNGPDTMTAEMVKRIIAAGAVIVGKTKTAQFASGEHARDWVDYQCPFHPRGDGYLDPDGSSTGSAVAIGAYEWLDYSLGTDSELVHSLGSMLYPAASVGVFAIRPTHGLADLNGIVPVSSYLDTAGFFARCIADLERFGKVWYRQDHLNDQLPSRVLYPTNEFSAFRPDAKEIMDTFVKDLVAYASCKQEDFDIRATWRASSPSGGMDEIEDFLGTTLAHIQLHDSYHNNLQFRIDFERQRGRQPYANPMVSFKWELGAKLSEEQYAKAIEERAVYRRFLREDGFDRDVLMVLPGGFPDMRYRAIYDAPPHESGYSLQGFGYLRDQVSFVGGLLQVTIPVGQVKRTSPVTLSEVREPVVVTLVGPPESDCQLMNLARRVMIASGRPLEVRVGRAAFTAPKS